MEAMTDIDLKADLMDNIVPGVIPCYSNDLHLLFVYFISVMFLFGHCSDS
jgi:hypothetical protein